MEIIEMIESEYGISKIMLVSGIVGLIIIMSLIGWARQTYIDRQIENSTRNEYLDRERNALIHLFEASNGNEWKDNTHWCGRLQSKSPHSLSTYKRTYNRDMDINDVRTWKGITCNEKGRIIKLVLADNNISGDCEEMFCRLLEDCPYMEEVDLRNNKITGKQMKINVLMCKFMYYW